MYSIDLKNIAIKLYYKYNNFREVADLLEIGKSTIHRWIHNKNNKTINNKNKLDVNFFDKLTIFVKNLIDSDKFITIKKIRININNKFNKLFSISFIHTIIRKKLKYSFKKINNKLFSGSFDKLHKKRLEFISKIKNIDKNKIICIDETYIHSNFSKNYGWNKIGERLVHYKKSNPIKYSIIAAISNKTIVKYNISKQNINSNSFKKFIYELNLSFNNHYFLMDNVSFHHSKIIKNIFANSSNQLLFIPPYSPDFNPIEMVFSQFKSNIKYLNNDDFAHMISESFSIISSINLNNFYKYSFETYLKTIEQYKI